MKNPSKKISGFTLVELIVVITILVILGTIAFISLGWYAASARDSARIENLANLHKGLSLLQVKSGKYPMPESPVNITASGIIIGYQGFAKDQIGALANISKWGTVDPADASIYTTYSVTADQTKMQLMAFLEEGGNVTYAQKAFAAVSSDYSKRYPSAKGDSLGILLGNTGATRNQPIQETGTGVDVVNTSTGYIFYLNKSLQFSWTGTVIKMWILRDGLIGYWNFEEWNGGTVNDTSGNGNNGFLSGAVLPSWISGKIGGGLSLNGNYVDLVKNSYQLWMRKHATFAGWMRADDSLGGGYVLSDWTSGAGGMTLRMNTLLWTDFYVYPNNYRITTNTTFLQNTWYHFAGVMNGQEMYTYVDGVKIGTQILWGEIGLSAASLKVWCRWDILICPVASYDDIRMYSRALSDSEIQTLYNTTK